MQSLMWLLHTTNLKSIFNYAIVTLKKDYILGPVDILC